MARVHTEARQLEGELREHGKDFSLIRAAQLAAKLDRLLLRALTIAEELDAAAGATESDVDGGDAGWRRVSVPPPREDLSNLCFGGALELRQMRDEIQAADQQELELLIACERASRKLRRVIGAILEAAERACDDPVPRVVPTVDELEGALAVRRLYARFARGLRSYSADDRASVLNALRYAAGSLAAMVVSAEFAEARIADRRMLLGLHARLLAWARGGHDLCEAERILSDVAATAELLRGVSRRQELRAHDRALVDALLADRPRDVAQMRRFLARMRGLEGADDQLDVLVSRAYAAAPVPDSLAAIREALGQLAESMR